MATGTYGNLRAADISVADLDMFYTYSPTREDNSNETIRLDPNTLLTPLLLPTDEQVDVDNLLGGLYNLTLPATVFNELGIYTIFLRAKQIDTIITDCGVLSALPTVKGIVLDINQLPVELTTNGALDGYRIEYINTDGTKLRNTVRYVVTSNKAIPVTENIGNTSQTAVRYRFDDSGSLLFLQVTPASASNVKPNVSPFIGVPNQKILLYNTNVNPLAVEVEMVENTIDTVVNYVGGEQIKDVKKGILTNYDDERNIIDQHDLFEIDDDISDEALYEVKQKREVIDNSQDFDNIVDSVAT
jgi:hypothetical protein